jgi:hypothetical protein
MAIKNIIAMGIGFSPGSVKFMPTLGFSPGSGVTPVDPGPALRESLRIDVNANTPARFRRNWQRIQDHINTLDDDTLEAVQIHLINSYGASLGFVNKQVGVSEAALNARIDEAIIRSAIGL